MGTAKIVTLSSRPYKAAQLCFEVGGIIESVGVTLGSKATAFDFTTFYSGLGATVLGDASRLAFDSAGIVGSAPVAASILVALRAEPRAAALDRAVTLRQNSYYDRYGNIATIVTAAQGYYGVAAAAKPARLANLATLAQQQADQLSVAYTTDARTGVIKTTNSVLNSTTTTSDWSSGSGQSSTSGQSGSVTTSEGQENLESIGAPHFGGTQSLGDPPSGGQPIGVAITAGDDDIQETFQEGTSGGSANESGFSSSRESGSQNSTGAAYAVETQTIINTDYGYRIPAIENQAQNERAQISLIDQQYTQFLAAQSLPNLATSMQNELHAIDLGVYQLQVGYLNTILMAPFAGVITGLYKNPGDCVTAGEPVMRVEDNSSIFLLATVVYRGPIKVGSTINVKTNLFDAGGTPTAVSGNVVALRCRGDDDRWDLVAQCVNPLDGSGNPTFPSGYVFDYDNTTATIV
jgi:biotin carboxyl carrier protein